ncbi:MAG: hypothetical protein ACLQAT_13475 [Candidatus Binataceae bacterium]
MEDELEAERVGWRGPRYEHLVQRQALRCGHVPSSLVLGGRRVKVQRPRARSIEGHELVLPSWRAWSSRDPLDERASEQMVLGVSTRRSSGSSSAAANLPRLRFCPRLKIGKSATCLSGLETLVCHPMTTTHSELSAEAFVNPVSPMPLRGYRLVPSAGAICSTNLRAR